MFDNRFRDAFPTQPVIDPSPSPAAFLLFPLAMTTVQGQWQLGLYEYALARAKEVVRPSLLERDRLAVWN